jgi:hypothetical protein
MGQNQQPGGGNSMAALLGNMGARPGQPPPNVGGAMGNYGGGMQPSTMGGAGPQQPTQWGGGTPPSTMQTGVYNMPPGGMQQPIPPGGAGYPQMSPDAMAKMQSQLGALRAGGGLQGQPSFGGPAGGGAPPKGAGNPQMKQAIAGLQGGPPMGRRPQMAQRPQGMMPPNPALQR